VSNPVTARSKSAISIETGRYYAMLRESARQSSSSFSNSSSYSSGSGRPPKCIIPDSHPHHGYSRGAEIFRNVEAKRAKEAAAKEKIAAAKEKEAAA
jgi:hypothetical protein